LSPTRGVQVGASFGHHVNVGIGYHFLKQDFLSDDVRSHFSLGYVAPFFEYSFVYERRWEVSIPVRVGVGASKIVSDVGLKSSYLLILYEPAMSIEYHFLKYFGIGAGIGYRLTFVNDSNYNLNSPMFLLKFRVLFGKLYKEQLLPLVD